MVKIACVFSIILVILSPHAWSFGAIDLQPLPPLKYEKITIEDFTCATSKGWFSEMINSLHKADTSLVDYIQKMNLGYRKWHDILTPVSPQKVNWPVRYFLFIEQSLTIIESASATANQYNDDVQLAISGLTGSTDNCPNISEEELSRLIALIDEHFASFATFFSDMKYRLKDNVNIWSNDEGQEIEIDSSYFKGLIEEAEILSQGHELFLDNARRLELLLVDISNKFSQGQPALALAPSSR